jgi:hypothetical protein
MEVTIDVTQEDISRGVKGNCVACPIALAVNRALDVDVCVVESLRILTDCYHAYLPAHAVRFMSIFDIFGKEFVEPFKFSAEFID